MQTEAHVTIASDRRKAADVLQQETGLSKQRIKQAMQLGAVWVTRGRKTQRLRRATRTLRIGDQLHLYYDERILAEIPPTPVLIKDCGQYSVWFKPRGMRSQGSKWGDHCALVRWVERNLQPERSALTVHRLDRAANGLILVAHSKKAAAALSTLFRERRVDKEYRVVVTGTVACQPSPLCIAETLDDRDAISEITVLDSSADGRRSLLQVKILTGRKHQIRRHLAAIGHPVIGDRLYGSGEADGEDLQLTAVRISFHCPFADTQIEFELGSEYLHEQLDTVDLDGGQPGS